MLGSSRREEVEAEETRRDTELTLGPAMLIGIFCGLVLLCGLCFGVGYSAGRRSGVNNVATVTQTATGQTMTAPPDGTLAKPAAKSTMPAVTAPQTASDVTQTASTDGSASQNALTSYAPVTNSPSASSGGPSLVHPALGQGGVAAPSGAQGGVQPESVQGTGVMVQVAAVSHAEDASVLVSALRKRGYAATARRGAGDELIHVQIGPFANRNDANAMSQKLLGDGYNAVVMP